jgi:molybdenum cofactor cytidylyltransferase
MGRLKQLLLLGDRTVIRHSIETLREAGVSRIVVVCGADPQQYAPSLENSGALLVSNEAAGTEMADSVRLGLGHIDTAAFSGILVCLADHPLVQTDTYRRLVTRHYQSPERIIVPAYERRRGHPSLFPPLIINDIFSKTSLREIVRQDPARVLVVDVPDEGVILDMDTETDYQKAVELYQARSGI